MNKKIISIYLFFSIVITFSIYKDYGISWDEGMQRSTARINFNYVFRGDQELNSWIDQDYGVVFELPLYIIEKVFQWEDSENGELYVFLYRHLFTHIFYLLGGLVLYLLVSQLFQSKLYGVLSLFLYMLQPRIYGHSFVNTKDIPLMVGFIFCYYTLFKYYTKRTFTYAILLGLSSAVLINIRILGIVFPVIGISFLVLFDCIDNGLLQLKKEANKYAVIVLSTLIFTYAFWPVLWSNPIEKFIEIFINMSHFRHNTQELVFGEYIKAAHDQTYFFKWFFTTVPLGYLIFGIMGLLLFFYKVLKTKFNYLSVPKNRVIGLLFVFLLVPLSIIILKKSVLYNGWRQLFFIYPSFIIMMIYTFHYFKKTKIHLPLLIVFVLYLSNVFYNQIKLHPYEAVYFNELVSKEKDYLAKNFEFDYWGISYKEAYEKLLKFDKSDSINIAVPEHVGVANLKILPLKDKRRLHYVNNIEYPENLINADYFISHGYYYNEKMKDENLLFDIRRYNSPVISIYKLK